MRLQPITLIAATLLFVGCGGQRTGESDTLRPGVWRATLALPGGDLPFTLEVIAGPNGKEVFVLNGDERVRVENVYQNADSVVLRSPAFNTTIAARSGSNGLIGALTLVKSGGKKQVIPFRASHGVPYRFFPEAAAPAANVSGRWDVTFRDAGGNHTSAVGEFAQADGRVTGTFLTPTGDYRYLDGTLRDSTLYLSCFDGAHAFLFRARLEKGGTLEGDFWSGTAWHETWTARRDPSAALPDAYALTPLRNGPDRFDFTFPDISGRMVSLSDARFSGKVVVVALSGSWCPNCHDEAAFLAEFYQQNRSRGLEVVALMYEHFDDFDDAAEQVRHFMQKFDITFEVLVAGTSDKSAAAGTLPMLEAVVSFPTTIFLDRSGRVRRVHAGFSGPGTGEHYEALKAAFSRIVDDLLAEGMPG